MPSPEELRKRKFRKGTAAPSKKQTDPALDLVGDFIGAIQDGDRESVLEILRELKKHL